MVEGINFQNGIAVASNKALQDRLLTGVSRTFALTIPCLPDRLADVVANAYLLCRIADTIEDSLAFTNDQKSSYLREFHDSVFIRGDVQAFSRELLAQVPKSLQASELELLQSIPDVVQITYSFEPEEQALLSKCVSVMCTEMPKFQRQNFMGLANLGELAHYCYVVAGSVGEMLFGLFSLYCPQLKVKKTEMTRLAVSFGQGLQMVNILKDVWDDYDRGVCWLPHSIFNEPQTVLSRLQETHLERDFQSGLNRLVGLTHFHLREALKFTCEIPSNQVGMRRFCSSALGMAVLTAKKIHENPTYAKSDEVKISRTAVSTTLASTNLLIRSNRGLKTLFRLAAGRLPIAEGFSANK